MKRLFLIVLSVLCIFSGCTAANAPEAQPSDITESAEAYRDAGVIGVWINAGQYSDGKNFVETMSLSSDGIAVISLEYENEHYATLLGTYTADGGVLSVTVSEDALAASVPYTKMYQYNLDANILELRTEDKTSVYRRSD